MPDPLPKNGGRQQIYTKFEKNGTNSIVCEGRYRVKALQPLGGGAKRRMQNSFRLIRRPVSGVIIY